MREVRWQNNLRFYHNIGANYSQYAPRTRIGMKISPGTEEPYESIEKTNRIIKNKIGSKRKSHDPKALTFQFKLNKLSINTCEPPSKWALNRPTGIIKIKGMIL